MAAAVTVFCLIALIALLLVIPVKVEIRGSVDKRLDLTLRFKYLFGLVCRERKAGPDILEGHEDGEGFNWVLRIYDMFRTEGLWGRLRELFKRLRGRARIENVDVDLSVSLGDDYYTGTMAGYLIPIVLLINSRFGTDISLQPAFEEDLFIKGHVYLDWSMRPVHVIRPLLSFYHSLPVRQARLRYYA